MRAPDERARAQLARAGLVGYLLLPALLTLSPQALNGGLLGFRDLLAPVVSLLTLGRVEIETPEAEALANVLLFLPLGLLLAFALPRVPPTLLLVLLCLASLGVEVLQNLVLEDRAPTLGDVLNNTGGAAVGLVVAADLRRRLDRSRPPPD